MSDQDRTDIPQDLAPPPALRRGPGAFAWVSLGLLALALVALLAAFAVGAYGGALVSLFAALLLSVPTLILMAVWIEVRVDNKRAIERYETLRGYPGSDSA